MNRLVTIALIIIVGAVDLYAEPLDTVSRSMPPVLVRVGGSVVLNAAVTEGFKNSVHEMRPDRTADNSFPSRHTSWVFTASTVLSNELYRHSPWWSVAGQAAASAVGFQRVVAKRHWASDVVAGAAIGVGSTELAYFISRKIFGYHSALNRSVRSDFDMSFAIESEAVYWLNGFNGNHMCTGFGTAAHYQLPLSEHWGAAVTVGGCITPVKVGGLYHDPISSVSAKAGAVCHFVLPCEYLALVCTLQAGGRRWIGVGDVRTSLYGFDLAVGTAIEWRLTHSFAVRGKAAYNLTTIPSALHAITLSVSSVVLF